MKIDRVLEAHGIGIVQIKIPDGPSIIANGLLAYWNSKKGVSGNAWENIAPATKGQYDAFIEGATVTPEGMLFDGANDYVQMIIPAELKTVTSATFEVRFKFNGGWADLINQEGRELLWLTDDNIVLSGMFDADKYRDHRNIWGNMLSRDLYLTVTADLTTNRITAYLHDPASGTTVVDYYTTTIGTFADGEFIWLSGTSYKFNGILDSVRLYNRVLTTEEIAQNRAVGANLGI